MESKANGALMRSAIIGVWARAKPIEEIIKIGRQEAELSHCGPVPQEANGLYCLIIALALLGLSPNKIFHIAKNANTNKEIAEWFDQANALENIDATKNIGYCKHAFMLVLYFLLNPTNYEQAIKTTLLAGGDTDTNGKIVGSLIGALNGSSAIPDYMLKPVTTFDCVSTETGHIRPGKYSVARAIELIKYLV